MRRIFLIICFATLCSQTLKSQELTSAELCNNTKSLYYFSSASNAIQYFLLTADTTILNELTFSSRITNNLLIQSKQFTDEIKKYNLTELPMSVNRKVALDKNLWHERNYFYIDKKTKRPIQVAQVVVYYEGKSADQEAANPIIKNVVVRFGKDIINRTQYLISVDKIPPAPPPQEKI